MVIMMVIIKCALFFMYENKLNIFNLGLLGGQNKQIEAVSGEK